MHPLQGNIWVEIGILFLLDTQGRKIPSGFFNSGYFIVPRWGTFFTQKFILRPHQPHHNLTIGHIGRSVSAN